MPARSVRFLIMKGRPQEPPNKPLGNIINDGNCHCKAGKKLEMQHEVKTFYFFFKLLRNLNGIKYNKN